MVEVTRASSTTVGSVGLFGVDVSTIWKVVNLLGGVVESKTLSELEFGDIVNTGALVVVRLLCGVLVVDLVVVGVGIVEEMVESDDEILEIGVLDVTNLMVVLSTLEAVCVIVDTGIYGRIVDSFFIPKLSISDSVVGILNRELVESVDDS